MRARSLLFVTLILLLTGGCSGESEPGASPAADATLAVSPPVASPEQARPAPAVQGLGEGDELRPGEHDRCPVCAMVPAKRPRNAAAIEQTDGTTHYFCGTGCMIRSWRHPEVYLGTTPDLLGRPVVQEYFDGKPIDARSAIWVAGSDVIGPMGPALVPLANEEDAATFEERHGGKHRFQLHALTDERWTEITGKPAVPAP
jgi:copper chaperone NosL